jgi:hypothetical protein
MKKMHAGLNAKNVFWPEGKYFLRACESAKIAFTLTDKQMHT